MNNIESKSPITGCMNGLTEPLNEPYRCNGRKKCREVMLYLTEIYQWEDENNIVALHNLQHAVITIT